jgi:hypothetical protein
MTFFGLTALGPQNAFNVSSTNYRYLQVFDEEDFRLAWRTVNRDVTQSLKSKLPDVFKALFRGPVPSNDANILQRAFDDDFETPETISLETFLKIMIKLRNGNNAQVIGLDIANYGH